MVYLFLQVFLQDSHSFFASGGYLIGHIFAVGICGYFAEKGCTKSIIATFVVMLLAEISIYIPGLIQLSLFLPKSTSVFIAGLYPFIIGDLLKMGLVALVLPNCWKLKQKFIN